MEPPADIWPHSGQRFSDIDFVRVNKRMNWVIKKPAVPNYQLQFGLILVLLCLLYYVIPAAWWPFTLTVGVILLLGIFIKQLGPARGDGRRDKNDSGGSGCTTGGCSPGDNGHHGHGHHGSDGHGGHGGHSGDSGCSASGCSGCSSGCSGCGGGGD